jgi:hypothetical protein
MEARKVQDATYASARRVNGTFGAEKLDVLRTIGFNDQFDPVHQLLSPVPSGKINFRCNRSLLKPALAER